MKTLNSDHSNGAESQSKQILGRFAAPSDEDDSEPDYFRALIDAPDQYNELTGKNASEVVIRRAALHELLGVTPDKTIVYQYAEGQKFKGLRNGRRSFWWKKVSDAPATLWPLSEIEYADDIFITEGESDALQLSSDLLISARHQNVLHAVAALANATAVQSLDVTQFKTKNVWLVMDQDSAGIDARSKLVEKLKPVAREIHFLEWDSSKYGKDWCELRANDPELAFQLLEEGWHKIEGEFPPIKLALDLVETNIVLPDQLIEGLLYAETLGVIGGGSKSYKSWSLLDLAISVAHGLDFWGFKTMPVPVLFINFEIGEGFLRQRLIPIMHEKGLQKLNRNFCVWTLRGRATEITKLVNEAIAQIEKLGVVFRLIIPDPIYKTYGGRAENSNEEMAHVLNELGRMARITKAGVLFSHHYAKGSAALKEQIDRMSGAGVFARDPDTIITLTPHAEDKAYTVEARTRYLPDPEAFVVRWQYPLMARDETLNPADLKNKPGPKDKYSNNEILELLEHGMNKKEWFKICHDELGISNGCFFDKIRHFTSEQRAEMLAKLRK